MPAAHRPLPFAHRQIEEKQYAQRLKILGIPAERIRAYDFAFEGKTLLIG